MRPLYQPQAPPIRSPAEQTFVPYTFPKASQGRPVPSQVPVSSPGFSNYSLGPNDGIARKISAYGGRPAEQRAEDADSYLKKKLAKDNKGGFPGFMKDMNSGTASEYSPSDLGNIKREDSQPDLRTTCPNVLRKFEHTNLRNTTHGNGLSKYGAIMAETKKIQEEEQRNMKKNQPVSAIENTTHVQKTSSTFSSQTTAETQRPLNRANFKSLNQMWSNKVSSSHKPKKNIINGFQVYKQLGKGKFGEVYLARHQETGFIVALKKIIKSKVVEYKMMEQFKRQIRLHSALDHPNIVKFYGFFEEGENIYLILEYISGGTLFDYLAEKDLLNPKQAAEYLKDTIEALSYMHERSIAHRDIKPENIVLTAEKVAKLCDFGWSALVESSRTTYCGTFDYAPPEILERKNYDTAVDIWCIGVLTFELLTGRVPFEGEKRKQIMEKILSVDKTKINYPVDIPEDARNFIQLLVQKDPSLRPKCRDLLKHPFFTNNIKPQNYKDKKM